MSRASYQPILAITMGDPAGIGPEIAAKAWQQKNHSCRLVCIGDARIMKKTFDDLGILARVNAISDVSESRFEPDAFDLIDVVNENLSALEPGKVQPKAGEAAYQYILKAIELVQRRVVDGVVTCPINKESLHRAGHLYAGHTEIFAQMTQAKSVTMMLVVGQFRATHVSTHCALREAIERCKTERVLEVIQLTCAGLSELGIPSPRIAVAGLNPHSGEDGLFGLEEREQIQPAIDRAREQHIDVVPVPVSPDTVFFRMRRLREFDAVVAQYHDQGHIPAKVLDFYGGVNVTLGTPIIRTSVDHGTAFDIVGKGIANPLSLVRAVELAKRLSLFRLLRARVNGG